MSFHKQKTINKNIQFKGVGLHSGKFANVIIKPAQPNNGIVFVRKDLDTNNIIYPHVNNVSSAMLCTTISKPMALSFSTSSYKQNVLELNVSSKLSSYTFKEFL